MVLLQGGSVILHRRVHFLLEVGGGNLVNLFLYKSHWNETTVCFERDAPFELALRSTQGRPSLRAVAAHATNTRRTSEEHSLVVIYASHVSPGGGNSVHLSARWL